MNLDPTIWAIQLSDGAVAIVDRIDEPLVAGFSWHRTGHGYVTTQRGTLSIYLARLILGVGEPHVHVDHINRDLLDNRRANLRRATPSQNGANRVADRRANGTTSAHKGVSWKTDRGYWVSHIHVDGKTRYLGSFADENEAARAYNAAALETWGEFARLNIIEPEGVAHGQ